MLSPEKFALLQLARRVWAIGAIHGDAGRLMRLHDQLWEKLRVGDRLVYLGNYIGRGDGIVATVDELLSFRRAFLSLPGMEPWDIAHLRGAQEEMWRKMLELQFATGPAPVLEWMLGHGLDATLKAYGGDAQKGISHCRAGPLAITRWTTEMRRAMQAHPGHDELYASLRRAALTGEGGLLFVHAGVDTAKPLSDQKDSFWWGGAEPVERLTQAFAGFIGVIAGFDPSHGPARFGAFGGSIDDGCGYGGSLSAYCFLPDGSVSEQITA